MNTITIDDSPLDEHRVMMQRLCSLHEPLATLLSGRTVHYVDVPMYGNVGDLLIMAGTLAFLRKHRIEPRRLAMYFNYGVSECPAGGVIVCQGGGNFGDIYGPFQAFRERLIATRHDCRIVVLPQSFHFSDDSKLRCCIDVCRKHPDLHLCVRDTVSQSIALQMTDNVYLVPDMAHHLWGTLQREHIGDGLMMMRRRDSETGDSQLPGSIDTFDWDDLVSPAWRFVLSQFVERIITQFELRLGLGSLFGNWFARWWISRANLFIDQAANVFSQHGRIETDRLHGHILACLLEIPNLVLDNSYGKNSRYMSAWTASSPLVSHGRQDGNVVGVPDA